MSDVESLTWVVVVVLAGFGLLCVVALGALWLDDRRGKRGKSSPQVKALPMFCGDCGAGLVSLRTQIGFGPNTGEPLFNYQRACPKASDPISSRDWPWCGQRVVQVFLPHAHNHNGPDEMSLGCPACLDVMVANGGISTAAAALLYDKAGVIDLRRD